MDDFEQLSLIRLQVARKDMQKRQLTVENNNLKVEYERIILHLKKELADAKDKNSREYQHNIEWLKKQVAEHGHKRESGSNSQREIELLQKELAEVLRREEEKREILYNELIKYSTGLKKLELKYRNDVEAWKARAEEESKAKQDLTTDNGLLKEDLESSRKENADLIKNKKLELHSLEKELEDMRWEKMQLTVSRDKAETATDDMKKKYFQLQKRYESVNRELEAKYAELEGQMERNIEQKTKIYDHCFEQRREYKILYRDFTDLKEELKEKEEEIRKLKAGVGNEKIRGSSREELTRLMDENVSLKQAKEEIKEDIELEFQEQVYNLEQAKNEAEVELDKALTDVASMTGRLAFAEKALGLANQKIVQLETAKFEAQKKIEGMNSEINDLKEYHVNMQNLLVEAQEKLNILENVREEENKIEEMNRNTCLEDEPVAHEPDFSFEFDDNSVSDEREEIAQKVALLIDNESLMNDVEFKHPGRKVTKDETTQTSDTPRDARDQLVQTEPQNEMQTADIGVLTDHEVAPVNLPSDKGHPRVEWVQDNNVTKLLLTFAETAEQVGGSSEDRGTMQAGNKRKQVCVEIGRKSLRSNDTEPVNLPESDAGSSNMADANLRSETPSPSKRSNTAEASTSLMEEQSASPRTKNRPEDALREKFLDLLEKMRVFETKLLGNMAFENQQSQLFQCMLGLLRNGDDAFMTQKVIDYLLSRKTDISLNPKKRDFFANGEKCIASCYAKFIPMGRSKIVDDFLRLFLSMIQEKEKHHMCGYASACLVYAMICESASHHTNVRTLCYKLLMYHRDFSVFLVACIYRVYPDARDYSDKKTVRFWLERVITHVLNKKPKGITDQKWQEVLGVFREDPSFEDKSGESPEHLLEEIMSDIRKYKNARYEDLREDFGHALMLLAIYYGKKWTNSVLKKQMQYFKGGQPRNQAKNRNILNLFHMIEYEIRDHLV